MPPFDQATPIGECTFMSEIREAMVKRRESDNEVMTRSNGSGAAKNTRS
jgi:hypothetical protein